MVLPYFTNKRVSAVSRKPSSATPSATKRPFLGRRCCHVNLVILKRKKRSTDLLSLDFIRYKVNFSSIGVAKTDFRLPGWYRGNLGVGVSKSMGEADSLITIFFG
jgi:hypothetical protein